MSSVGRCPHCGRDEETAHYACPDINPRPNNPPPDELAAVRFQIQTLQTREAELRTMLLANPDIREGANWLAEIKEVETKRLDIKELRAMHRDLVDEYTYPQKTVRIELSGISSDGEIVHPRRFKNAVQD